MNPIPKIIKKTKNGAPPRNYFCEQYNECLDFAIQKKWDTFSCEYCKEYNLKEDKAYTVPKTQKEILMCSTKVCPNCGRSLKGTEYSTYVSKSGKLTLASYCTKCISKRNIKRQREKGQTQQSHTFKSSKWYALLSKTSTFEKLAQEE